MLAGQLPPTFRLNDQNEVIPPGTGPLSASAVLNRESRILSVASSLESASDLECLIAGCIDALRREVLKREANVRAGFELCFHNITAEGKATLIVYLAHLEYPR